ncbi:MAG: hypothetical protein A2X37_02475 [Elusimicrobia bacterium GWA2_66_18]|nr:MAG: hypothetical protein A2X37_02475 [Elusimicrobia bacterium GWA2_66_18]
MTALLLVATALIYIRSGYVPSPGEFGILVERAYRVASGEMIYRDFETFTTPLSYYLQAVPLRLFGPTLGMVRGYIALQGALMTWLCFAVLRKSLGLGRVESALAAAFGFLWSSQWLTGMPWYSSDAYAFIMAATAALLFVRHDHYERGKSFFIGLCCALTFLCKQDLGAAALILGLPLLAAAGGRAAMASRACFYVAGALLPFAAFAAWLSCYGVLGTSYWWIVERALSYRVATSGASLIDRTLKAVLGAENCVGKLLLLVYWFGAALSWRRAAVAALPQRAVYRRSACAAAFLGGIYFVGLISYNSAGFSLLQEGVGCALGIAWAAVKPRGPMGPFAKVCAVAGALTVSALALRSFNYMFYSHPPPAFEKLEGAEFSSTSFPRVMARRISAVTAFIGGRIPPDEPVLLLPPEAFPAVYLAVRRLPPLPLTAFSETINRFRDQDQKRWIAVLQRRRLHWAIIAPGSLPEGFLTDQPLGRFLAENFERVADAGPDVLMLRRSPFH